MRTAKDITYPLRASSKGRAVVSWKGDKLDLGKYGTSESLLTFLSLRTHLIDGGAIPKMAEFRKQVFKEYEDETRSANQELQSNVEKLRVDLAHKTKLHESSQKLADDAKHREQELKTTLELRNQKLRQAAAAFATTAAVISMGFIWALFTRSSLSEREKELVEALRQKSPKLVSTDTAGWVDNVVLTDWEIEYIRGIRDHETKRRKLAASNIAHTARLTEEFIAKGVKDVPKVNPLPEHRADLSSNRYVARRVGIGSDETASHNNQTSN